METQENIQTPQTSEPQVTEQPQVEEKPVEQTPVEPQEPETEEVEQEEQPVEQPQFDIWKPDETFLNKMRSEDPKEVAQALEMLRDGLVKQALQLATYYTQQQLSPIQQYVEAARDRELNNEFYSQYADLKDHKDLVDAVAAKLIQQRVSGTKEKIFKLVATETRRLLGSTKPKMSTLAGGGQTPTTKVNAAPSGDRRGMEVFED